MEDIVDKAALWERVGGDEELLGEIVVLFLDDCPRLLKDVRDAVLRQDAPRLKNAAHALKGSVGNFGAKGAYEAALRLEGMGDDGDLAEANQTLAALEAEMRRLTPALAGLVPQSASA